MNKIVYFKSKFPKDHFPHEGLQIALFLWDKLNRETNESLYIKGIFDFYDDLHLLFHVWNGKNILTSFVKTEAVYIELTFYRESEDDEFSLMVDEKYKNKKIKEKILEKLKNVISSEDRFFDIRWEEIKNKHITKHSSGPLPPLEGVGNSR